MTSFRIRVILGWFLTLGLGLAPASAQVAQRMAILGGQTITVGQGGARVRTVCIDRGRPEPGLDYKYGSVAALPGGNDAIVAKMIDGQVVARQPLANVLHDPAGPLSTTAWLRIEGQGITQELLIKPLRNDPRVTYRVEIGSSLITGKDVADLADGQKLERLGGHLAQLSRFEAQLRSSADYPIPALRDMAYQKAVWDYTDGGLAGGASTVSDHFQKTYRELVRAVDRDLVEESLPGLSRRQSNFLAVSIANGDLLSASQCRHLRAFGMIVADPSEVPISRTDFRRLLEEAKQLESLLDPSGR